MDPYDPLPDEVRARLAALSEQGELQMLRDAVQAANNVVVLSDPNLPDNPIVYVNDGFLRLTGFRRDEVLGRNCRFLQGDDRDQAGVQRLREALAARRAVRAELRNYRKDGSLFWNELYVTPVVREGRLTYFVGVQNDVTARKEAEAARDLLQQAVESADEAVVITEALLDPPGPRVLYVNRAFTAMTGYRPEEVVGRTPRRFQGPETDRAVLERMRYHLAQGRPFEGETVNYRKDGSAFVLAWTVSPIRDPQGRVLNWISTQHDVTERRRLERETLDISAREQRRIAGDLHDALQQLVGTALHAKALAVALADEESALAGEAQELYDLMQENVRSLRTVVQGVVPVQPNENGLMVALDSLCARMTELYRVPCTFSYETPVRVDDFELAAQLYYVAQEAVVNALKHGHARGVGVSLVRTGGHVALTVRDDGQGFRPGGGVPATGGMGLRLMAYRARLVGARFGVASEIGVGTTVTCVFKTP